ncbi:BamA/TamA family outer membrane protein [Ensifer sp.]|uniref:BamA/TamA family outer membrane protein n=1 Tax=Ensifer sp. TaxID=1872086 RepID=UPI00289FE74C|nr:BamA/TamA family outer membrane protein [Ensifer sp.]
MPVLASDSLSRFIDPEDGYLDVSGSLNQGGFIPVPIIITEPAVEGGIGVAGQFIHPSTTPGVAPGRTIAGGAYTGNGSWGGGLLRQGTLAEGQWLYRFGLGVADVTLPIFPFGGSNEVDYRNAMKFAFGNIRYKVPETSFSVGPRFIYRTSDVSLSTQGPLADRVNTVIDRFAEEQQYTALGLSLNYDTRDNPFSPTQGINAIFSVDVYSDAFGGDREFTAAQLDIHAFQRLDDMWSLGAMVSLSNVSDAAPFFMSPGVNLRGVQSGRYQGDTALSMEAELRRQLTPRWAVVVFGGYGQTFVNNTRLYEAQDNIWTYGAGIRYRIADKLGIDVGLDVARGPEDTTFYIQFGHAWARTMD